MEIMVTKDGKFTGKYVKYIRDTESWIRDKSKSSSVLDENFCVTKLNGTDDFVFIYEGKNKDDLRAELVSDQYAIDMILDNGRKDLLEKEKFRRLKEIYIWRFYKISTDYVQVQNDDGEFTGKYVEYNSNLDAYSFIEESFHHGDEYHDHLGITMLKSTGEFVLITQNLCEKVNTRARVVTDEEALSHIIDTGHSEMLEEKKFARLKMLLKEKIDEEV